MFVGSFRPKQLLIAEHETTGFVVIENDHDSWELQPFDALMCSERRPVRDVFYIRLELTERGRKRFPPSIGPHFVLIPCVRVNEIVACVVRRVYVDALDSIALGSEQTFQDFEIFSLNDRVPLGKLWIHRALVIVLQRCERRREGVALRVGLPKPTEFKALGLRHQVGIDEAFQLVRVECPIVSKQIRHKRTELFQTFLVHIQRGRHSIHNGLVHKLSIFGLGAPFQKQSA